MTNTTEEANKRQSLAARGPPEEWYPHYVNEDEDGVVARSVSNGRIERSYTAFTSDGQVHIRVREEDSGTVVLDSMHGFDLADNGETVVHSGKHWREHALDRFKRLNEARFRHEFTDLRGAL